MTSGGKYCPAITAPALMLRIPLLKIMETRPLSKTKRWRVVEIVERAK